MGENEGGKRKKGRGKRKVSRVEIYVNESNKGFELKEMTMIKRIEIH